MPLSILELDRDNTFVLIIAEHPNLSHPLGVNEFSELIDAHKQE